MIGTEFRTSDHEPDKGSAKTVVQACLKAGLLLITCGTWDNTVRWIPPLTVEKNQIQQALEIFGQALEKTVTYKTAYQGIKSCDPKGKSAI